jgi:hypothetical protein
MLLGMTSAQPGHGVRSSCHGPWSVVSKVLAGQVDVMKLQEGNQPRLLGPQVSGKKSQTVRHYRDRVKMLNYTILDFFFLKNK